MLSSEERMSLFYLGEKVDRVPFISSATMFSGREKYLSSREFYFDIEKSYAAQEEVLSEIGCDGKPCFDLPDGEILDFGGELVFKDIDAIVTLPKGIQPINSIDKALNYYVPNFKQSLNFNTKLQFEKYAAKKGHKSVSISGGSPFTMLGYMIEPTTMLKWLKKEPQIINELLEKAKKYLYDYAVLMCNEFGVKNCSVTYNFPFESNDLISEKIFEKIALPHTLDLHKKYIELGIESFSLHLCGNHNKNLPLYKDILLKKRSFISSDEKNDLLTVSKVLGTSHIYAGNVSSGMLVFAKEEEIYKEAVRIIEKMKYNEGGFVLMPSCDLPINAKKSNLIAMRKACENAGRY